MQAAYDAVLIVAFGGPEGKQDVIPFLENVLRGRNVPRARMLEVAEHYYAFGGISPINAQVRALKDALCTELVDHDIRLPVYWGNRNWHPMLADTMQQMADDGVKRALALVLSAYSSYSSCRQYLEDIERAQQAVGEGAPHVDKIRAFYNHPDFIAANAEKLRTAVEQFPEEQGGRLQVAYTAHSIPQSMADGCDYVDQLNETCRIVSESLNIDEDRWNLVYQSRSGRPGDPWLEPDICDHLRDLNKQNHQGVVIMPIGFLSDHIEILFDLDEQAQSVADELKLHMVRAETVGTHPLFITMLRQLIEERLKDSSEQKCAPNCCPAPQKGGRGSGDGGRGERPV